MKKREGKKETGDGLATGEQGGKAGKKKRKRRRHENEKEKASIIVNEESGQSKVRGGEEGTGKTKSGRKREKRGGRTFHQTEKRKKRTSREETNFGGKGASGNWYWLLLVLTGLHIEEKDQEEKGEKTDSIRGVVGKVEHEESKEQESWGGRWKKFFTARKKCENWMGSARNSGGAEKEKRLEEEKKVRKES